MAGKPGTPEEHALMLKYSRENNRDSESRMVLWLAANRGMWRYFRPDDYDPFDEGSW